MQTFYVKTETRSCKHALYFNVCTYKVFFFQQEYLSLYVCKRFIACIYVYHSFVQFLAYILKRYAERINF